MVSSTSSSSRSSLSAFVQYERSLIAVESGWDMSFVGRQCPIRLLLMPVYRHPRVGAESLNPCGERFAARARGHTDARSDRRRSSERPRALPECPRFVEASVPDPVAVLADMIDAKILLGVLADLRGGDFTARMPLDWTGVAG